MESREAAPLGARLRPLSGTITGRAGAAGGDTMTSRTDERAGPGVGRTASQAKRITLLCWLLVLTMAASAECAWVLWLKDVWTVAPTATSPSPHPPMSAGERIDHYAADPEP